MPNAIARAIEGARSIVLTTTELDGDAVGSIVALQLCIQRVWPGKAVRCVAHERLPERYSFIVPDRTLFRCAADEAPQPVDLAIVLDGDPERLRTAQPHYDMADCTAIIDHHKSSANAPCDVSFHDPSAASTTEMVLRLVDLWQVKLDRAMASSIYAGLIFDTSVFRYGHTDAGTLRIAARLVETGIDHRKIVEKVLFEQGLEKVRLKGRMISAMQLEAGGQYAWACLSAADVNGTETGGLVDDLVFVGGVEVGALLVERAGGRVKGSLRSRGAVDVSDLAQRCAPTGGGHPRSAGVTLDADLRQACDLLSTTVNSALLGD